MVHYLASCTETSRWSICLSLDIDHNVHTAMLFSDELLQGTTGMHKLSAIVEAAQNVHLVN